jgi:hypothetical protein
MLKQISAARCAIQVKYSYPYRQFNVSVKFKTLKLTISFEYTPEYQKKTVEGNVFQENKARRYINNNVSVKAYNVMKDMFKNGFCYICNQSFGIRNDGVHIISTLDGINY